VLDFELLRAFVAVADYGGFHRAAERLNLTQSTISQQVKRLELETKRASPHRLGEELYAIGIAGPIARFDENRESYVASLRDAARAVAELNVGAFGGAS
jgi:hypothetical protein